MSSKYNLLLLALLLPSLMLAQQREYPSPGKQVKKLNIDYNYLLFTPTNTEQVVNGEFPLIIFLHGAGERGDDLSLVKKHGPPKIVEENPDFPFMVLSPQCPKGDRWDALQLGMLLDHIVATQPVDMKRIYLTGLSMGGFGTWDFAIKYPRRFAAIAPICGGSIIHAFQADKVRYIPAKVFHGAKDQVVPVENSRRIVAALEKLGAWIQYTEYPEAGHDSWTETYADPKLYEWFLSIVREEN